MELTTEEVITSDCETAAPMTLMMTRSLSKSENERSSEKIGNRVTYDIDEQVDQHQVANLALFLLLEDSATNGLLFRCGHKDILDCLDQFQLSRVELPKPNELP